ncbi:MAG: hypothetical protein PHG47_11195 [Sulfuricella sp.]|nr:hypothetical protein [Sulfuricella sp.]
MANPDLAQKASKSATLRYFAKNSNGSNTSVSVGHGGDRHGQVRPKKRQPSQAVVRNGVIKHPNSSRLVELLAQPLYGTGFSPDVEKSAFTI